MVKSIWERVSEHSSETRTPVANSNSITAISRRVELYSYVVRARVFCLYIVRRKISITVLGTILGRTCGSRNFTLSFSKGF